MYLFLYRFCFGLVNMAILWLVYRNINNHEGYGYFKNFNLKNLLQRRCREKEGKKLLSLYKQKKEEKKVKEEVVYSEIPEELLLDIIQRLSLPDRLRVGMVCKSWRSALSVHSRKCNTRVPWLMLPYEEKSNCFRFFDFDENQLYSIKLPKKMQGAWYCGSSKGWLVMVKGPKVSPKIFLFNPISGVEIPLPPLETIPCFQSFVLTLEDRFCVAEFVCKVELSSVDVSRFIVAATFYHYEILAFCRPEDESWTIFQGIDYKEDVAFEDILFSNGILHAMIRGNQNKGFGPHTVKLRDENIIVKLTPQEIPDHPLDGEIDWIPEDENEVVWTMKDRAVACQYLVESRGELLVVRQIADYTATFVIPDGHFADAHNAAVVDAADDDETVNKFSHLQTSWFQVFKIEHTGGDTSITGTKFNSLDDRTLFVSETGSLAVEGRDLKEFKKNNCILFLDCVNVYICRESGIFHFETGRIDRCFPVSIDSINCQMDWFSPNI